jgi:hypothetical protein
MQLVIQIISLGATVQISQSVQSCVSPASGSDIGRVSMCTSAGLTIWPSVEGSVMIGAWGEFWARDDAMLIKTSNTIEQRKRRLKGVL